MATLRRGGSVLIPADVSGWIPEVPGLLWALGSFGVYLEDHGT